MTAITDLSKILERWLRWLRIRRAAVWALRGLVLGLALALVIGWAGMLQARLLKTEFLTLGGMTALAISVFAALAAYLWPVRRLKAARYFDRVFGLAERVSTALELNATGAPDTSELLRRQLDDALGAARTVKPERLLPLRWPLRDGLLALICLLLLGLTWFRGEDWFQAAQQARAVQQAAAAQSQKIEQILVQIKNDPALSDEQKHSLSAPLQQALNDLHANPSFEGTVSVLSSAGEKLQALSGPQTEQMAQALKQAGSQAAAQPGSPLQSLGQKLAQGQTVAAASELANLNPGQLSQAQAADLAGQLDGMAQSLAATNPQLAADLQAAAQALRNGDSAAAQQALQQAAAQMAQSGQQVEFSQTAGQAAQQMQQGAGQVLAAGGGQQQAQAQGSAGQSGQSSGNGAGGSGQGQAQGPVAGTGQAGSSQIPQNAAGDGGETPYEKIYAPTSLGGQGGPSVNLPGSGQGGDTVGQGPSQPPTAGQSLVPYNQVYSQYNQLNNQAIENGSIPFEFVQIIKNYFDSLQP